jgi:hypothetical protein
MEKKNGVISLKLNRPSFPFENALAYPKSALPVELSSECGSICSSGR